MSARQQARQQAAVAREPNGRVAPGGGSLNPGGRPKAVRELLELARAEAPASIALAVRLRDDGEQDGRVRLEAAKLLLAYGLGAPPKALLDDASEDETRAPTQEELAAATERLRLVRAPQGPSDDAH